MFDDFKLRPEKLTLSMTPEGHGYLLVDPARAGPFDAFEKGGDPSWYVFPVLCSSLMDNKNVDVPIVTYDHNYWMTPLLFGVCFMLLEERLF